MNNIQVKSPSGEVLEVKDTDLPALVKQGYQLPNKDFEFEDDSGNKYDVPAFEFDKAIQSGWKYRDAATKKNEELEKKYGDQTVKALLYGGLRGATLGLSDVALAKTGMVAEEELKEIKDRNEVASTLGDVGGTILPAVLSGGTGAVARIAAKTPAALASKAALSAGGKVAGKLATQSAAKQAIARSATAGAVEGFLVGEGQLISEAAIGDAEFNAESMLAYGGTGAALGGGLGALGQVGVDAFRKTATKSREYLKATINKMDDKPAAKAMLEKLGLEEKAAEALEAINPNNEALQAAKELGINVPDYVLADDLANQQIGGYLGQQGTTLGGRLAQRDIGKVKEGLEIIQNSLLRDQKAVSAADLGSTAKQSILSKIDEELALPKAIYSEFEEIGEQIPLTTQIRKLFRTRVSELPYSKLEPQKAQGFADLFDGMENVKDLKRFRTIIGNEMKAAARAGDINKTEFLDDLYSTATRARDRAIETNYKGRPFVNKAGQQQDLKESIKLADQMYSNAVKQYSYLEKVTGKKIKSISGVKRILEDISDEKLAKNLFNLKDMDTLTKFKNDFPEVYDTARAKFLGEIKDKSVSNGKLSPVKFANELNKLDQKQLELLYPGVKNPKSLIKNFETVARSLPKDLNPSGTSTALFLSEMMNPTAYMAKQTGDLAAYLLWSKGEKGVLKYIKNTAMPLANIQKAAQRADVKIGSTARGFLDTLGRTGRTSAIKAWTPSENQLNRAKDVFEQVQSDPEGFQQQLEKNNKQLFVAAPNTGSAYQTRMIAAVNFLASKVPARNDMYLADNNYQPPKSEIQKFNEYLAGVEQPFKVLEMMKQGYVSPRSLEAIKVVYPKIYDKLQAKVLESLAKKPNLTNSQKVRLQELLGMNFTPTLKPQVMALLQQPIPDLGMAQAGQQMRKPPVSAVQNIGAARRSESGLDRVVNRS